MSVKWVSRHLERLYWEGWVTDAKNNDTGKKMLKLIITERQIRVGVGLVKIKTTVRVVRMEVAYATPEKEGIYKS